MILLRFLVSRLGFVSAKSKFGGFATFLRAPLRFLRFVSHQRFLFWKFASTWFLRFTSDVTSGSFCFVPLRFTFVNLALCLPGSLGLFVAVSTFGPSLLRCRLAACCSSKWYISSPVYGGNLHLNTVLAGAIAGDHFRYSTVGSLCQGATSHALRRGSFSVLEFCVMLILLLCWPYCLFIHLVSRSDGHCGIYTVYY